LLIFIQSIYLTTDAYSGFHYNKQTQIPVLSFLKRNIYNGDYGVPYFILSGTNTGYGFYGIHTSTEKYLVVTFFGAGGKELKTDRYFNFSTSNGYSRLKGFATYLANYVSDLDKMKKENSDDVAVQRNIQFREKYVDKVFKWLGQKEAALVPGCVSYKITLLTIVPVNIWSDLSKSKPQLYVIKEKQFPVE
jgi:tmRNA-binding protein